MTSIKTEFSAKEAMVICGFSSVYMLDYLQRTGVFIPRKKKGKRRGKGRRYEFRDLLVLKAIKKLLDSGASVSNLKRSLEQFQKLRWEADPVTLEDKQSVIKYLIINNDTIYLRKDANVLIELSNKGQLAFSFIIDLETIWNEIRTDLGIPDPQITFDLDATGN